MDRITSMWYLLSRFCGKKLIKFIHSQWWLENMALTAEIADWRKREKERGRGGGRLERKDIRKTVVSSELRSQRESKLRWLARITTPNCRVKEKASSIQEALRWAQHWNLWSSGSGNTAKCMGCIRAANLWPHVTATGWIKRYIHFASGDGKWHSTISANGAVRHRHCTVNGPYFDIFQIGESPWRSRHLMGFGIHLSLSSPLLLSLSREFEPKHFSKY